MPRKKVAAKKKPETSGNLLVKHTTKTRFSYAAPQQSPDVLEAAYKLAGRLQSANDMASTARKLWDLEQSKANALALVMAWKNVRGVMNEIQAFDPDTFGMSLATSTG